MKLAMSPEEFSAWLERENSWQFPAKPYTDWQWWLARVDTLANQEITQQTTLKELSEIHDARYILERFAAFSEKPT